MSTAIKQTYQRVTLAVRAARRGSVVLRSTVVRHAARRGAMVNVNGQQHGSRAFHSTRAVRATPLTMPALSPTMTEGNLTSWMKKEGDAFRAGDVLAEVETDKATVAFEATEDGFLAKIVVPAGTQKIQVGTPIAITVTDKSEIASAAAAGLPSSSDAAKPAAAAAAAESKPAPAASSSAPAPSKKPSVPHTVLQMPALSPTMSEGTLVRWNVKEGDLVKPGDAIAEIETDKATVAFEATEEGYIAKFLVEPGAQKVSVNAPIAVMTDSKDNVAKLSSFTLSDAAPAAAAAESKPAAAVPTTTAATPSKPAAAEVVSSGDRVFASPLARKLANEKGIDISQVSPTGPNNRILAADVIEFTPSKAAAAAAGAQKLVFEQAQARQAAAAGADYVDIPVTNIRRVTAERLTQSKQTVPHYYLSMDCNVDKLLKVREELNASATKGEYKLSVNDFIIKAASLALHKVPECNSEWRGDFIRRYQTVDINVAVSAPQGLFTPLIRNADQKGLATISGQVKDLADKVKTGKIALQDIQPGTFSISNLGMFGVSQFAAVILPPQACILAVGGTEKRLVPAPLSADGSGPGFTTANVMNVTLSCDHRVVDGSVGAQWLQAFKDYIENPLKLLL